MALGITIPSSTIPTLRSPCCSGSIGQASLVFVPRKSAGGIPRGFLRKEERGVVLKCGVNMGCVATVGEVTDVDKDTFWPIVETAAPKIVVVDMYTQWYVCMYVCMIANLRSSFSLYNFVYRL